MNALMGMGAMRVQTILVYLYNNTCIMIATVIRLDL